MESILKKIVRFKRNEIEAKAALGLFGAAEKAALECRRPTASMKRALLESPTGIIAEFKRRSPSRSDIHPCADPATVVPAYEMAGAAACSVLTDTPFFGGSLSDLAIARSKTSLPLLRKDFIIDTRQLFEARAYGADAVLLIASCLEKDEIERLAADAHALGLEVLLELHGERELDKVCGDPDMIGVNNRNLANFHTDLEQSARMAALLPEGAVKVTESGIGSMAEASALREAGYKGFLIGTTFMQGADPGLELKRFIHETGS